MKYTEEKITMNNREIKWSQWDPGYGMTRCGQGNYNDLMDWMMKLGLGAYESLKKKGKDHAIYGRKIYDENDNLIEVRFYTNTYVTDQELEDMTRKMPRDHFYVAHRH